MKKIFIFIFVASFFLIFSSKAQKINVDEGNEEVESINRTGLFTVVNLDGKKVEKAWEKKLKEYGKVSSSKGAYIINAAEIPGVTSKPGQIYSKVVKDKNGTKIWWAIDMGTSFVSSTGSSSSYKGASQILTDFAAECYRNDVTEQVEEAEKALAKTVKAYEKEVKEGEDLVKAVDRNKQEKAALEQKLVDNASELKSLQSNIEQNKVEQKNAQAEIEKMKKAVEVVKSKMNSIGK